MLALSGERRGMTETEKVRACSGSGSELLQCERSKYLLCSSKTVEFAHLVASENLKVRGG